MREEPPRELIELLGRLDLATAAQVAGMHRRVRRLARDLPLFESVWVDTLAQARILTPFQAAELNAGRGESLRVGPYVLCRPLFSPGYLTAYRARQIGSRQTVRLAVFRVPEDRATEMANRLEGLVAQSGSIRADGLAVVNRAGLDGDRGWAATRWFAGRTALEWMVHNGRFPPETVLEIARQMLAGLVELEKAGWCHGDVSATSLILTDEGRAMLAYPGLRGIVRPQEGYAHADLPPENYDYLPPERITDGTPPTLAGDVYACGCLWWHLLTGRPPVPGGDSLAKLRAGQGGKIPDLRYLAPDAPAPLAAAISAGVQRDAELRPESMARLAAMLAVPTRSGRLALARCMSRGGLRPPRWVTSLGAVRGAKHAPLWPAVTAGCLVIVALLSWSVWQTGLPWPLARIPAETPEAIERQKSSLESNSPTSQAEGNPAEAAEPPTSTPTIEADADLVLAAGGPLAIESLELRPGQCVRGEQGQRPLVVVPAAGLVVRPEEVRFENIDFVWEDRARAAPATAPQATIIQLEASRAEFHGCSFQTVEGAGVAPVAIRWTHPVDRSRLELALPSGRVLLSDCVFRGVGPGVASERIGALAVESANVLYLDSGPLVRLDHCPRPDEPVVIGLSGVTLRGGGPLLECRYARIADQPGKISVRASGCALLPGPQAALLCFAGPKSPDPLLKNTQWTGQGSLVSPEAVIAAWRAPGDRLEVLDDASVSIAGLVRNEVEFAGPAEAAPEASRIIRWQVPLRSPNPPGIDPRTLPPPML